MNATTTIPAVIEKADRASVMAGVPPLALVPQTFEAAWRFAELITRAGMAPKGLDRPEACMVALLHGLEVGMTPMAAIQSIAIVNGRPSIWGDGAMALVRGSGLCEWIQEEITGEGESMVAACLAKRKGDPKPVRGTFSIADAKKAGLWGKAGPWQQYPRRMLQMRARAFCLRDGFADVLRGVAVREEMEDVSRSSRPVIATRADSPPPPPTPPKRARKDQPAQEAGNADTEASLDEARALVDEFVADCERAETHDVLEEYRDAKADQFVALPQAERTRAANAYQDAVARLDAASAEPVVAE